MIFFTAFELLPVAKDVVIPPGAFAVYPVAAGAYGKWYIVLLPIFSILLAFYWNYQVLFDNRLLD